MLLKKRYVYTFDRRLSLNPMFNEILVKHGKVAWNFWRKHCNSYFNRSYKTHFVTTRGQIIERNTPAIRKNHILYALERPYVYRYDLRMDIKNDQIVEILQNGAQPGAGAYNPVLGYRIHHGRWAGITREYWKRWDLAFTTAFTLSMKNAEYELEGNLSSVQSYSLNDVNMFGKTLVKPDQFGHGYISR